MTDYFEISMLSSKGNKHLAMELNSLPAGTLVRPFYNGAFSADVAFKVSHSNFIPTYMQEMGFSSPKEMADADLLPEEAEETGEWAPNNGESRMTTLALIDEHEMTPGDYLVMYPTASNPQWVTHPGLNGEGEGA